MTRTETSVVTWGETRLLYTIGRSTRRSKTVAVTVDPTGTVLVVAPQHVPVNRLDTLVRRKAPWIVQQLRNLESLPVPPGTREFVSGESVFYLGRHYRLRVHSNGRAGAKLRGGWLHVPVPDGVEHTAYVRATLVSWFRRKAEDRLPGRVRAWSAKAGVAMPRVAIVDQQKRWGSCDRHGNIRLNWRIIQAPMRLVDYVIVHELIHQQHQRHGAAFWQAVGRVIPDYERRRQDLRQRGSSLVW